MDCIGGPPPPVDLDAERRLQKLLIEANQAGILLSAHDCSDGGLAVALAEACIGGPYATQTVGAELDLRGYAPAVADHAMLYGEDHARVVISLPFEKRNELATLARRHGVPLYGAGRVTAPGTPLAVRLQRGTLRWDVSELRRMYFDAIPRRMRAVATSTGEGA
jgi:phosphoribosylformylglycinamidine synthase